MKRPLLAHPPMRTLKLTDYLQQGDTFQLWHHRFQPGMDLVKHDHDFDEIFWVVSGDGWHTKNGQLKRLVAGDLLYLGPGDWHKLDPLRSSLEFVNIDYPHQFTRDLKDYDESAALSLFSAEDGPTCRLAPYEIASLGYILSTWIGNRRDPNALRHLLMAITHAAHIAQAPSSGSNPPDWFRQACSACNDPEVMRAGLPSVYRAAGRSPEHVARVFQQFAGMSPRDWLNNCRLEYTAKLLIETSRPVPEVSLESGFKTLSHFYDLFKKRYGTTALAYRRHRSHANGAK